MVYSVWVLEGLRVAGNIIGISSIDLTDESEIGTASPIAYLISNCSPSGTVSVNEVGRLIFHLHIPLVAELHRTVVWYGSMFEEDVGIT